MMIPSGPFAVAYGAYVVAYSFAAVAKINEAKARRQCFTVRPYVAVVSPLNAISVGVNSDSNCRNS